MQSYVLKLKRKANQKSDDLTGKGLSAGGGALGGLQWSCMVFFFLLFRATLVAYGGSQASGQIRATASGLHHSHSNTGSETHLRPTPQLNQC